jgi:hypothetical protein
MVNRQPNRKIEIDIFNVEKKVRKLEDAIQTCTAIFFLKEFLLLELDHSERVSSVGLISCPKTFGPLPIFLEPRSYFFLEHASAMAV